MVRSLVARRGALEQARETALRQWWETLSEHEQQHELDARYGAGTWDWLCGYVDGISPAELDDPAFEARLVAALHQWRETQP